MYTQVTRNHSGKNLLFLLPLFEIFWGYDMMKQRVIRTLEEYTMSSRFIGNWINIYNLLKHLHLYRM